MKFNFSLIIAILSCIQFYGQSLDREEQAFQCISAIYKEEGVDLREIIKNHENLLIAKNYLDHPTGESYRRLLQRIVSEKEMRIDSTAAFVEYDRIHKLGESIRSRVDACSQKWLLSDKESKTKWQQIVEGIKDVRDHEIPKDSAWLCEILLEKLSENDLDKDFYKLKTLVTIDFVNERWGRRHMLESIPE